MNKILISLLAGMAAVSVTSCMEVDNFDEPEAKFYGKVIDKTTGEPILAGQGEGGVRLWEMSYSLNPSPQDIPMKQDGTFSNYKLFNGTYDVQPRGAWWPEEKRRVPIGRSTKEEVFEVTPYLHINDFTMELDNTTETPTITVSCRLEAPRTEDLPRIMRVRPFLSLTHFCSNSNCIGEYNTIDAYYDEPKVVWDKIPKDEDGMSKPYTFTLPVKRGYYYFVRMGAYVDDEYKNYNYSEIQEIQVPLVKDAAPAPSED